MHKILFLMLISIFSCLQIQICKSSHCAYGFWQSDPYGVKVISYSGDEPSPRGQPIYALTPDRGLFLPRMPDAQSVEHNGWRIADSVIDGSGMSLLFTNALAFQAENRFVYNNFSNYDPLSRLRIIKQLCTSRISINLIVQSLKQWIPLMPESSMNILDPQTGQALCHMLTPFHRNRDLIELAISRGVNFAVQSQLPDYYDGSTIAHNVAGILRSRIKALKREQGSQKSREEIFNYKRFIMLCLTLWPEMKDMRSGYKNMTVMDILDGLEDKEDINTGLGRITQIFSGDLVGQLSKYEESQKFNRIFHQLFGHRRGQNMLCE